MDVIDLLIEDHDNLRKDLTRVSRSLFDRDLRERIRLFISRYELHESIEEEILFPSLHSTPNADISGKWVPTYETEHEKIWTLLDQLVQLLGRSNFSDLQQLFFKFNAAAEAHMRNEERVLFPTLRKLIDQKILEALGRKAKKRMSRFTEF